MYCDFYQLHERPFNVTPDPKFLYLNARYREAIASLHYGITQRKGFITLIGEAGTGKTTLLKRLLDELDAHTRTVFLFNTNVSFEEILEYIFNEFDLPVHSGKKLYMLQRLNTFLLEELRQGRNVALLIDEAQDLEYSVLEDLRLLSNLETAKEKILQIVLSGQPELGQKLSNPVLRQLRQRISVNCRLLPLSREEVSEYIHFRLEAAGAPDTKLFTRDAEDLIYQFSRGIPRLVNVVCDNALVIGYAMGKKRITADIIKEAAADLLPGDTTSEDISNEKPTRVTRATEEPVRKETARQPWWQRLVLGGAVVAMGLAAWTAGRTLWEAYSSSGAVEEHVPTDVVASGVEVVPPSSRLPGEPAEPHVVTETSGGSESASPGALAEGPNAGLEPPEAAPKLAMLADVPEFPPGGAVEALAAREPARAAAEELGAAPEPSRAVEGRSEGNAALRLPQPPEERQNVPQRQWPAVADVGVAALPVTNKEPEVDANVAVPSARPEVDVAAAKSFTVRPGDSLSSIARARYGQSSYTILDLIKLANPQVQDVDWIVPGQTLELPELGEGPPILRDAPASYSLLVFSTPNQGRAHALAGALRQRGFDAQVRSADLGAQKKLFRVTVRAGVAREEAQQVAAALQRVLRDDPAVVRLGQ